MKKFSVKAMGQVLAEALQKGLLPASHTTTEADMHKDATGFKALLEALEVAMSEREYAQAEQIANLMLEKSPSEEADRALHELLNQTAVIRDAEDEAHYALQDLKVAAQAAREDVEEEDGL